MTTQTQTRDNTCSKCKLVGVKTPIDIKKEGKYWGFYEVGTNYTVKHWHVKECTGCKDMGIDNVLIKIVPFRRDDMSTGWKPQNVDGSEHKHGASGSGSSTGTEGEDEDDAHAAQQTTLLPPDTPPLMSPHNINDPDVRPNTSPTVEELTLKSIQSIVNLINEKLDNMNAKLDKHHADHHAMIDD